MKRHTQAAFALALGAVLAGSTARAAVSAQEAEKLKSTLTPLGAEKAGNKEGTIPAWTGGLTTPTPGFKNGGKRPDPFAGEKPLFSITAKNMDQYADKLTDGTKAMLKKYASTYRIDVYPTHRTAAAPQWVYDNTFKNATRAKVNGQIPVGAYGGIPFPIPQSGLEAMWNHLLRWRPASWHQAFSGYLLTADGKRVLTNSGENDHQMPYYFPDGSPEKFNGDYWLVVAATSGPPIRAGEAIVGRENIDPDKVVTWVYLTGQRRVRKLPNSCCDTPTPFSAGVSSFDEVDVFTGADTLERFDWKLVGKKEMYIPYNSNRTLAPTTDEVLGAHHLNPDHVRWELHRVWVVEAAIKKGTRHTSPKNVYYLDEDTWNATLADRWDAKGQLWRTLFSLPVAAPDVPVTTNLTWGFHELLSGTGYVNVLFNGQSEQYRTVPRYPDRVFTPDALAGQGVR
ncbi:MAG: DUF1329 domain-containing protein [Deltaproteobacteria bacterium]|nr:DUF1329 domain-containing protein [Deltaproteobacteria bacterium]